MINAVGTNQKRILSLSNLKHNLINDPDLASVPPATSYSDTICSHWLSVTSSARVSLILAYSCGSQGSAVLPRNTWLGGKCVNVCVCGCGCGERFWYDLFTFSGSYSSALYLQSEITHTHTHTHGYVYTIYTHVYVCTDRVLSR